MLHKLSIAALCLLAPIITPGLGEVLDRLAATVNGHALLQSDVDEELRYEYFAAKRPLREASTADEDAVLGRLIDQELLRQQMRSADFKPANAEDVAKALETFKSDYGTGNSWNAALAEYGISENAVRNNIETELNQLRLIDLRLRPGIQVDSESIRNYYEQQLLPKLPPGPHPSLQDATATIRELLTQQKMNEALESWLEALRSQAKIERLASRTGGQSK